MTTSVLDPHFPAQVALSGTFDADACMNCGVCTSLCPMGIDILPRRLFHLVVIGDKEKVLEHTESLYSCLLCRMCESNCPADVHITANIRALRGYVNRHVLGI
jgi:heterodisulfide reductase subunit C